MDSRLRSLYPSYFGESMNIVFTCMMLVRNDVEKVLMIDLYYQFFFEHKI